MKRHEESEPAFKAGETVHSRLIKQWKRIQFIDWSRNFKDVMKYESYKLKLGCVLGRFVGL